MIKTEKKLSIFLNLNNLDVNDFTIVPNGLLEHLSENQYIFAININVNIRNKVEINFHNKKIDESYLQISKIMLGNIELNHLDSFCTYYVNGKIKKTYGWMDEVGSCIINIHSNAVSQNLLLYLLSKHE